jgi:hypothetical protein
VCSGHRHSFQGAETPFEENDFFPFLLGPSYIENGFHRKAIPVRLNSILLNVEALLKGQPVAIRVNPFLLHIYGGWWCRQLVICLAWAGWLSSHVSVKNFRRDSAEAAGWFSWEAHRLSLHLRVQF